MKFVDFNDKALKCISLEQWQELAIDQSHLSTNPKAISDEQLEVTIVCLSYDDGVRSKKLNSGSVMTGKTREVVHKDLIHCHYAEIYYVSKGYWRLHLNIDKYEQTKSVFAR